MSTTPLLTQPSSLHDGHGHGHARTTFGMRAACTVLVIIVFLLAYMVSQRNELVSLDRGQLAQANAEAVQAKTDLVAARTRAAGLQSQLDQARAQQAETGSQFSRLQTEQKALEEQLKDVRAGRAALESQLTGAGDEAAGLQERLSQAEARSSWLARELEVANGRTADLKAQFAKARTATSGAIPAAVIPRGVPVSAAFEKSFWSGYTLHVSNLKGAPLRVKVTVVGMVETPVATTMAAGAAFELKHLATGANVIIAGEGYDSLRLTAL
jgi:multidrug efflux pump subunit AcrA (membrane-fusion protein)